MSRQTCPTGFSIDPSHFALQSHASESSSSMMGASQRDSLVEPLVERRSSWNLWKSIKSAMSPSQEIPDAVLDVHREAARRIDEQEDELARAMAQMVKNEVLARLERENEAKKRELELGRNLAITQEKEEEAQRRLRVVTSQLEQQRDSIMQTDRVDFDHRQRELERRYKELEEQEKLMADRLQEVAFRRSSGSSSQEEVPNTRQVLSRRMLELSATHEEEERVHEAKASENRRLLRQIADEQERMEEDRTLLETERQKHETYCMEQLSKHETERLHLEMEQDLLAKRKKELVRVQAKTLAMIEDMQRSESPLVASLHGSSDGGSTTEHDEDEAADDMWDCDWTLREEGQDLRPSGLMHPDCGDHPVFSMRVSADDDANIGGVLEQMGGKSEMGNSDADEVLVASFE